MVLPLHVTAQLSPCPAKLSTLKGHRFMRNNQARIVCYTTGGTIASRRRDIEIPAMSGREVIGSIPDLDSIAQVDHVELASGSSAAVTADDAFLWATRVNEELAGPDYLGGVVTVGTDTLEEIAYL